MSHDETRNICITCLEEVSEKELNLGLSPCCNTKMIQASEDYGTTDLHEDPDIFNKALKTSDKDRKAARAFIAQFPADSKKRRKGYNKPTGKNAWPGKLSHRGLTYKAPGKSGKSSRGDNTKPISLDITSDTERRAGHTVEITGKYTHTIHAENKTKSKRKARAWLRGRLDSITNASSVIEEPGKTVIHYEGE